LSSTITHYLDRKFRINLVAHSNGADVVLKALKLLHWPKIHSLHLISPACKADFYKNGINKMLKQNTLNFVVVYIGRKDLPLWLVSHSHIARWMGYGALGKLGPQNVDPEVAASVMKVEKDFGHSGWFVEETGEFDSLMAHITGVSSS